MCYKYSFLLTRAGQILDGEGITESHSEMATLHQVGEDSCNKYEWQPPKDWPAAEVLDGLVKDAEVFVPKASALKRISTHLAAMFPTRAAFEAVTLPNERWHEQKVTIGGREITIICKPGIWEPTEGTWWAYDGAQVAAWENSQVTARGNSQVTAWGNSQVTAWENSTIFIPANNWYGKVRADLRDKAVLLDRMGGKLVVSSPADVQTSKVDPGQKADE